MPQPYYYRQNKLYQPRPQPRQEPESSQSHSSERTSGKHQRYRSSERHQPSSSEKYSRRPVGKLNSGSSSASAEQHRRKSYSSKRNDNESISRESKIENRRIEDREDRNRPELLLEKTTIATEIGNKTFSAVDSNFAPPRGNFRIKLAPSAAAGGRPNGEQIVSGSESRRNEPDDHLHSLTEKGRPNGEQIGSGSESRRNEADDYLHSLTEKGRSEVGNADSFVTRKQINYHPEHFGRQSSEKPRQQLQNSYPRIQNRFPDRTPYPLFVQSSTPKILSTRSSIQATHFCDQSGEHSLNKPYNNNSRNLPVKESKNVIDDSQKSSESDADVNNRRLSPENHFSNVTTLQDRNSQSATQVRKPANSPNFNINSLFPPHVAEFFQFPQRKNAVSKDEKNQSK